MNIFQRAGAGLALSVMERTFLRFLKALFLTVLTATLPIFSDLINALSTDALHVDWQSYGYRLLTALGVSLLFAIQKYFSAQGDGAPVTATSTSSSTSTAPPDPTLLTIPNGRSGGDTNSFNTTTTSAAVAPVPVISQGTSVAALPFAGVVAQPPPDVPDAPPAQAVPSMPAGA